MDESNEARPGRPIAGMRKLVKVGGSVMISLPKDWLEQHVRSWSFTDRVLRLCAGGEALLKTWEEARWM